MSKAKNKEIKPKKLQLKRNKLKIKQDKKLYSDEILKEIFQEVINLI